MIKLQRQLLDSLDGDADDLKSALRIAIQLELWTIPPYLYALFSIKPGRNCEISGILRSVVKEEMMHLALNCNVLNALGEAPRLNDPMVLPRYPSRPPGSVDSGIVAPLAPFSKQLAHSVLMAIEEPEHPLPFPFEPSPPDPHPHATIGQFYRKIREQICALGDDLFLNPRPRLTTGFAQLQTFKVTNARSAMRAIKEIIHQGEGSEQSPLDDEQEPAHYYRLAEIVAGKKLILNPSADPDAPKFLFGGNDIPFDEDGVWPVLANPRRSLYDRYPRIQDLNDTFNRTYTRLLDTLHLVFDKESDYLAIALGLMESLKDQAGVLMALELLPGQNAGPTFECLS